MCDLQCVKSWRKGIKFLGRIFLSFQDAPNIKVTGDSEGKATWGRKSKFHRILVGVLVSENYDQHYHYPLLPFWLDSKKTRRGVCISCLGAQFHCDWYVVFGFRVVAQQTCMSEAPETSDSILSTSICQSWAASWPICAYEHTQTHTCTLRLSLLLALSPH